VKKKSVKPTKELRMLRVFARYVYGQLGQGPRTNGINQDFCEKLGKMAKDALQIPHSCFTTSSDEQVTCDDPECPRKKKRKAR
jgi:hypothetical protein